MTIQVLWHVMLCRWAGSSSDTASISEDLNIHMQSYSCH